MRSEQPCHGFKNTQKGWLWGTLESCSKPIFYKVSIYGSVPIDRKRKKNIAVIINASNSVMTSILVILLRLKTFQKVVYWVFLHKFKYWAFY